MIRYYSISYVAEHNNGQATSFGNFKLATNQRLQEKRLVEDAKKRFDNPETITKVVIMGIYEFDDDSDYFKYIEE